MAKRKEYTIEDYNRMMDWIWDHMAQPTKGYTKESQVLAQLQTLREKEGRKTGYDSIGQFFDTNKTYTKQDILTKYTDDITNNNTKFKKEIDGNLESAKTVEKVETIETDFKKEKDDYEKDITDMIQENIDKKKTELKHNVQEKIEKKEFNLLRADINKAKELKQIRSLDAEIDKVEDKDLRKELKQVFSKRQEEINFDAETQFKIEYTTKVRGLNRFEDVSKLASEISKEAPTTPVENEIMKLLKDKEEPLFKSEYSEKIDRLNRLEDVSQLASEIVKLAPNKQVESEVRALLIAKREQLNRNVGGVPQ
jgi:hypothetical protein